MDIKAKVSEISKFIIPYIITSGGYAVQIQQRIERQTSKTQFAEDVAQALTDADLSVQNFIEVALLSRYPEVKFYGEECDKSLNQKYFTPTDLNVDELEIWLDPIDGTLRYLKGYDEFSVIVSFVYRGEIVSSIWHLPKLNKMYTGSIWDGVELTELNEFNSKEKISLSENNSKILTYNMPLSISEKLNSFEIIDLLEVENEKVKGVCPVFFEKYSAIVSDSPGVIDLLIGGYFLKWAGGVCTDLSGKPIRKIDVMNEKSYQDGIIAASNSTLHKEILNKLTT